jgi:hypothetical protein
MGLLEFSAKRPVYLVWQQAADLVLQGESEPYTGIRTEAKDMGTTIYFSDESDIS